MKKFISNSLLALGLLSISGAAFGQANVNCDEMEPICTDAGLSFTANSGVANANVLDPGNNYGCLSSQPNPTWYYFEIATAGNIDMSLFAPSDIDFIIYGPFPDLAAAQAGCGTNGTAGGAPIVDCSYSATNNETPSIPNAQVGEVYVMLITNYANTVQDVTLSQTGGTGSTDCSIVEPDPCESFPGTFTVKKNGNLTSAPLYLCEGDSFLIESNGDYILPNDTIAQPVGDGVYSAQIMWLVYDAAPVDPNPSNDPGYLNLIIPGEDISDVNDALSPIISNPLLGCGTYWLVPVAGDDGVGGNGGVANGTNDNGGLDWDKNGNGCYLLGTPIEITYACEIQTLSSINCNPPTTINGIDVDITGGSGDYTVTNLGAGNLASTNVPNGGTATVSDMSNNNVWEIQITDEEGCTTDATGVFAAPVITNVTLTPAPDCPAAGTGDVDVTVGGTSGQGAPYTIVMAGDPPTVGTTDSYTDVAGTIVPIVVSDVAGCISDSTVTIPSAGHYIDVDITALQGEQCYGDGNGSATITATPLPTGTVQSVTWIGPSGQTPGGNPGGAGNLSQSGLEPGIWTVCVVDNIGCEVCIPIEITAPQELDLYLANSNEPVCYGYNDGSITVQSTGGSGSLSYTWNPVNQAGTNTFNNLGAGTYWAYVTDVNGCQDSLEIDLGQPDSLYADFFIKDILCYGDSSGGIYVTDVYNAVGNVSYFWNLQGIAPNPPSTSNLADGLPVGTYVITIQDEYCDNQYEFTLTQNDSLYFTEFGYEPAYCRQFGFQSGNGVVFASASGGVPDYDYIWMRLEDSVTTTSTTWGGQNPGLYQMTVTDDVGCTLVQTVELDSVSPIASFNVISAQLDGNLEGTAVVCADFENTSQYFANPNNPNADTTFFWELGYNLPWQVTHDYFEVFDTCYYEENVFEICLVAINKNGCTDTACQTIIVHDQPFLNPPNVFTPGGQYANNTFHFMNQQQAIEDFHCVVVDRWGVQIFEFNSVTDEWDGTNKNGKDVPDGVYFYRYEATFTNGTETEGQGNIHLIRDN